MQLRLALSEIHVREGRRQINEDNVRALASSMEESGLINPITIDCAYNLIAGAHRLEAARRLGWDSINCNQIDVTGLQAELAEIDENLIRHNFNRIEEADQLLRRKEIYEELHPDTKQGISGGKASGKARGTTATVAVVQEKSFAADTAEKTGMAERTIRGKIQIAKGLTPEVKETIRGADISERNAAKLARIKDAGEQREAAELLASKRIKTVEEYHSGKEPPEEAPFIPVVIPGRRYKDLNESIRDLKDVDKERATTPEMALMEFEAFAEGFIGQAVCYADQRHMTAFEHMDGELARRLNDACDGMAAALLPFYNMAERILNDGKKKQKKAR